MIRNVLRERKISPQSTSNALGSGCLHSVDSLTPSQLNQAIMEMLNLNPNATGLEKYCQGNPFTRVGKRFQLLRLIGTVMIPIITLVSMVGHIFGNRIQEHLLGQDVRFKIRYSLELSQMMHTLQIERDMSALYTSSIASETKGYLVRSYPDTDKALEGLSRWPTVGDKHLEKFQSKENFLNYLNHHRYTLDTTKPTVTEELDFYSYLMREFMQWFYDAIMEARSGTVWKDLVSLQEIVEAREAFGIERALGTIFFTTGSFANMDDYLRYVQSQDIANVTLNSAREYSPLVDKIYNSTIADIDRYVGGIRFMRYLVRRTVLDIIEPSLDNAILWYDNMTGIIVSFIKAICNIIPVYLDALLSMQNDLSTLILVQLRESERSDAETIIIVAILFTVVLLMCPLILNAVYSLTSNIQSFSITLANRTRALNKEKKRTDVLYYQMLPKCVAQRLRNNEEVTAESFDEVSVLFSDIVSFTAICAQSSPMQIVNMLNNLYMCFDHYIGLHDVYKLETMGDAYLLTSGLPIRNESNHVKEIANIAIELLDKVSSLETPHMPGTYFRIRIGCHTGPVIASVVGTKMPRYCLFGDTINMASKIACSGKAGRIHISELTHKLLEKAGGYVMTQRQDPAISSGVQLNANTYWLLHEEGKQRNPAIYEANDPLYLEDSDIDEDYLMEKTGDGSDYEFDNPFRDTEMDNPFISDRVSYDYYDNYEMSRSSKSNW